VIGDPADVAATSPARGPRFRGETASTPVITAASLSALAVISATAILGLTQPWYALTFFAVGAGAGYSLSGSV